MHCMSDLALIYRDWIKDTEYPGEEIACSEDSNGNGKSLQLLLDEDYYANDYPDDTISD